MIITLTGPSAAGKTTLEGALRSVGFVNIISTTTRPQRVNEVNGESYYFVSPQDFNARKAAGEFVESVVFNGNQYAISCAEVERVLATRKPIVVVIEPEGLKQMKSYAQKRAWPICSVFIDNAPEELASRFLRRFATELKTTADREKAVVTYAGRMASMMTTEREWSVESQASPDLYDFVWERFDATNTEQIVRTLAGMANINLKDAA